MSTTLISNAPDAIAAPVDTLGPQRDCAAPDGFWHRAKKSADADKANFPMDLYGFIILAPRSGHK